MVPTMPVLPHITDILPAHGSLPQLEFSSSVSEAAASANTRIIPVTQGDSVELPVTALTDQGLLASFKALGATGKHGELTKVVAGGVLYLAVGLGEDEIDDSTIRSAMGVVARELDDATRAVVTADFGVRALVEGLLLGGYAYNGLKSAAKVVPESAEGEKFAEVVGTNDTPARQPVITIVADEDEREEFDTALTVCRAVALARDLVNTPANLLYPENYADIAATVGRDTGLDVEVFDETALKEQGFGGIIGVGQGSSRPPRLVHLTWNPAGAQRTVALVGKGITFDSGGISIKPADGMEMMLMDMGGSAAVLAAACAAAALELPVRVEAWLALAENMPSGTAQRPGDVITHYGGITSEIINTDAEGRLVLADAIARASEDNPDYLIEASTLTGAQMIALGKHMFGVMGSDGLRDTIAEIGRSIDEPGWAMPLLEEHDEEIASKVADLRNTGLDRYGGMMFAGTYLSHFVGEDIEWAHLDVAGPAMNEDGTFAFTTARGTGVPTRTLIDTLSYIGQGKEI